MTIDELLAREAIRHTMACYTMAGDRLQVDNFISVFTDDAIYETEGVAERDSFRCEGRQQILAWIQRWREAPALEQQRVHQARFTRHHLSTCLIEFDSDLNARARTYWTAYTDIGADHGGVYVDAFRRCDQQWLIAHRRIRMDWRAPNSLMLTAIARTQR